MNLILVYKNQDMNTYKWVNDKRIYIFLILKMTKDENRGFEFSIIIILLKFEVCRPQLFWLNLWIIEDGNNLYSLKLEFRKKNIKNCKKFEFYISFIIIK